ncbi:NAD-dependent protein deacetylase Sirt2 [Tritrichomonas foetus]|uniref:NAD-dependent protein deacetylase n=1 Tax=Tritrichomonas foetus TaxID=1144522 RepID=A0A1J4JUK6_9EUKA|nr:NAD-dependent protein deacetylase Sirt2 [Tritrichomonas foetus]|eukprot:OHT01204.1 NAD-dependent protein deacetylase Sirt2 [Tritrichomonas foetus]
MQGAGISCAAGIPDFRSPGTGLYHNLQKYNLPTPESIFDIDYFRENPEPFFQLAKETMPGSYKPTPSHYLPVILQRHGLLLRVFTQNIDGLERVAGIPSDKVVEAHGTYFSGTCQKCKQKYTLNDFRETILKGEVAYCSKCKEGVIKPDIVFYGEDLPRRFFELFHEDFPKCDLLIIIGTSLQVHPFAGLIYSVKRYAPRVLINNEKVGTYQEKPILYVTKEGTKKVIDTADRGMFKFGHITNRRDVYIGGDCQDAVRQIIDKLGWTSEFETIINEEK